MNWCCSSQIHGHFGSLWESVFVIPAEAGIQGIFNVLSVRDSVAAAREGAASSLPEVSSYLWNATLAPLPDCGRGGGLFLLKMPAKERAEIAQRLLESLDRQMDIDVESAWQSEVERRISELDSDRVTCIPWEEVRERLIRNSRSNNRRRPSS